MALSPKEIKSSKETKVEEAWIRVLHRLAYLSFPLVFLAIYTLSFSIFGETKELRHLNLGTGLLWLGFAMGFQSLGKGFDRPQPRLALVFFLMGFVLFVLAGLIFLLKPGGLHNPIGLGLCSAGLGLLSMGRDLLKGEGKD